MGRSTRSEALRGVAGNLAALTLAGVSLYVAMLMGIRWAAFGLITIGVFFTGYTLTYCLLWLGMRGRGLKAAAFLTAPLWLAAGAFVAHSAYQTPVRCGPGVGQKPFVEVAGSRMNDARASTSDRICLPDASDVAATLLTHLRGP